MPDEREFPSDLDVCNDLGEMPIPWHQSSMEEGSDTDEVAKDFVYDELRKIDGFCSWQRNGKVYILHSKHSTREINVTVETKWKYQGKPRRRTDVYKVAPRAELKIRCNIPPDSSQRFDRRILTAWFN